MITLPSPGDIQVATSHPEVEALRAAIFRASPPRLRAQALRGHYERARDRGSERHVRMVERALAAYLVELADVLECDAVERELEQQAAEVAPDSVARLRLSVAAYRHRLLAERERKLRQEQREQR